VITYVADKKVVGRGNDLSTKCSVSAISRSANCKKLNFHVKYTVTETYGDHKVSKDIDM